MLLITAIFFVKIAQAIPGTGLGFGGGAAPSTAHLFYQWMAGNGWPACWCSMSSS
jgi:hypothetical protein